MDYVLSASQAAEEYQNEVDISLKNFSKIYYGVDTRNGKLYYDKNKEQAIKKYYADYMCTLAGESVECYITGMVVEYLTHCILGATIDEAFFPSIYGASNAEEIWKKNNVFGCSDGIENAISVAANLLSGMKETFMNKPSIESACKLVTFDTWYRNPKNANQEIQYYDIVVDKNTVESIKIMLRRCKQFFKGQENEVCHRYKFKPGACTDKVAAAEIDFLTKDTLWDFKVSKYGPVKSALVQLLIYFIMGIHSDKETFDSVTKIGVYNPRQDMAWVANIDDIPTRAFEQVEKIIGYKTSI